MFKVYSTPTCAQCSMVKKFLKIKEVPYEEINLEDNQQERERIFELSGKTAVPVVTKTVDNEEKLICVGWNSRILTEAF